MKMLHILIKSPFFFSKKSLLRYVSDFDDLICIQDGVILGVKNNILLKEFSFYFRSIYLLKQDIYARGLIKFIDKKIKIISYSEFVKLTLLHKNNITW